MSKRLRSLDDLADAGFRTDGLDKVVASYDFGISPEIIGRITSADDPIGRQFIPSIHELNVQADEQEDPIGDEVHSPVPGIVHRYPDRVLFKVTNVCAVYCRYCFRREKVGAGSKHLSADDFEGALEYIKTHPEIWEVILTGGDPFVLSAEKLDRIVNAINDMDHVKVLRIHSRIPVANPSKISDTILGVLERVEKSLHVVLHVNHADEVSSDAVKVLSKMRRAGCSLLSQSVLLRGVNDRPDVLENLFRTLVIHSIQPYYLHHLDRAKGTSHFRVTLERGQELMQDLQGRISGICLPRYMLDIPGGHGKVPINDATVRKLGLGRYEVTDYRGFTHLYVEADA